MPSRLSDDDQDLDGQALRGGVIRLDGGGVLDEVQKQELRKIAWIVPPRGVNTSQEDYQGHGFTQRPTADGNGDGRWRENQDCEA